MKPFEILSGNSAKGLLLLCDHACNRLPQEYGTLGLGADEMRRHIAYDIGTEALTRKLSKRLEVPAVLSNFSRLLIDPNRGADDPTLIRQLYDGTIIPGNYPLDASEREKRIARYYQPYHQAIDAELKAIEETGQIVPAIFSVHSMTDKWNGHKRPWQLAILWDNDSRFAMPMLEELRKLPDLCVGDNEPYDGALGGDTLFQHCTSKGLSHVLLEVRQDLLVKEEDIDNWVDLLVPVIEKVNGLPHNHKRQFFGSRTGLTG